MNKLPHPAASALALATLVSLAAPAPASAKQLGFERQLRDGVWEYQVAFVDGQRRRHRSMFRLNAMDVERATRLLKNPEAVQRELTQIGQDNRREYERRLEVAAEEMLNDVLARTRYHIDTLMQALPSGSRIHMKFEQESGEYIFTGDLAWNPFFWKIPGDVELMKKYVNDAMLFFGAQMRERERALDIMQSDLQRDLQYSVDAASQQMYSDGLMVLNQYSHLRIDYRAATRKSLWHLRDLSHSLDSIGSDRDRVDKVLGFFQSIPYEAITDRHANSSLGFRMPAVTIDQNIGDCDSKAVGAAAVIKSIMPHRGVLLVLVPGHAFLAMQLTPRADDDLLDYGGSQWVMLEPVGPGLRRVGSIAPSSLAGLKAGLGVSFVEL